ncbi:MAG TPA: hypothetical protein VLE91_01830, partial [Candidatus Saccharimonadales bacterium]|nr:hypothetical protein [Candidatus Saccharimonadales bacterium]
MKILGHEFFGGRSAEQATTPVVTADPVADAQSRVDLIQNNLNTLTAGREMEAGSGTPNVDTTQIVSLSAEKAK